MQIPSNNLPALTGYAGRSPAENLAEYRQPATPRFVDTEQKNRQQTVEYVLQGELLEEVGADQRQRTRTTQNIAPANQGAIANYTDTATDTRRQGRLLDIFI